MMMMGLRLRTGVRANDLQDHVMCTVSPSLFRDGFSIGLPVQTIHSLGPLPEHDYRYGSNINISRFVSTALNRTRKFVEARKPF